MKSEAFTSKTSLLAKGALCMSRQSGFTLVELMVVVAIIGLLSAVAIPNFRKHQARAKTTEAKLQLASIYTAEQAFFSDYSMYSNCLRYMGYDPSEERSQRHYMTGFPAITPTIDPAPYNSAINSGLSTAALVDGGCPNSSAPTDGHTFFAAGKGIGNSIVTSGTVPGGQNPSALSLAQSMEGGFYPAAQAGIGSQINENFMTFRAVASGFIDPAFLSTGTGPAVNGTSIFSINQRKQIFNPRAGY